MVYSSIDSFKVRNIFTTVYVVLNTAISLIGSYYLKRSAQRILLQRRNGMHRTVPITHLTSWLTLASFASYVKAVRKIPGGGFGLLMIGTGIFGLLHQYFTNSFINTVTMVSDCTFYNGSISTSNNDPLVPATTWPVSRLVYEAYLAAQNNGGKMGIYDKINYNTTSFWPQDEDILGWWGCTQEEDGVISPSNWSSSDALQAWISSQNFLSMNRTWSEGGGSYDNGTFAGFLVMSASDQTDDLQQWDFHAAILYPISGDSDLSTSNYQCNLTRSPNAPGWLPPIMPAVGTLGNWSDLAYGIIQDTDPDYYGFQLENILNGMTMIAGSGNTIHTELPSDARQTYSCVSSGTQIGLEILVLLAVLVFILLSIIIADLYALVIYWRDETHSRVREIPLSYLDWQLDAVREATSNRAISERDLARFGFGWIDDKQSLGIKELSSDVSPSYDLLRGCHPEHAKAVRFDNTKESTGDLVI